MPTERRACRSTKGTMEVRVTRSTKRAKTVSAKVVNGVIEISAPASCSDTELAPIIDRLQNRIAKKAQKRQLSAQDLENIAQRLNHDYYENKLQWASISWSTNQNSLYGSCTPALRTIRISHRLAKMPLFVQEYVVMHELGHLIEANHSPKFWALVNQYPLTERARGYLMAIGLEEIDNS
jgi:predicted metal-dependent hydrolase